MAPQRGAKERADAAIVESVVVTEFGCEPVSTHRIILALRERGYGEHSRRMAGRWQRLMAKCVEFDESGDSLWTSRTMTCPHDNVSLPSTSDPQTVCADCGQVPNCTVLRHSLEVYHRIDADPDSLDAARLWALLHDCHEILTGDVVRPYVTARLRMDQQAIDNAIVRRLPLLVPQPESIEWGRVMAADRAVGEFEIQQIEQGRTPYDLYQFAEKSWASLVREFIKIGGAA